MLEMSYYVNCPGINNDSWHIKVGENPYVNWNDLSGSGWRWIKFPNEYPLEKGNHVLVINQREDGAMMARIKLTLK